MGDDTGEGEVEWAMVREKTKIIERAMFAETTRSNERAIFVEITRIK